MVARTACGFLRANAIASISAASQSESATMSLAGTTICWTANGPPIVIVKCLKRRPRLPRSVQRDGKRYQRCADAGHDSSHIIGGMIFSGIER
jgi:hypothetical protein